MTGPELQVCFTPALLGTLRPDPARNVVVVDILRATTAICMAFGHGVRSVLPLASEEEALRMKQQGWLVAGETDGVKLPFADYGNSPLEFRNDSLQGRQIAYSTTNGTKAIRQGSHYGQVYIASFVNLEAVCGHLSKDAKDVLILCAGWKDRFSLEDAIFAGAMADVLVNMHHFHHDCDSVAASIQLWHKASRKMMKTVSQSSHFLRLLGIETRKGLRYCFFPEKFPVVPALVDGMLVDVVRRA